MLSFRSGWSSAMSWGRLVGRRRRRRLSATPSGGAGGGDGGDPIRQRRIALVVVGGGGAAVVVATTAAWWGASRLNEYLGGGDGLLRTLNFYSLAIPKYAEYRMHMIMDSPDEVWERLHAETSKAGLDKIMELQGFYVKSGQMCAANVGNAFPPVWRDTMAPLQDSCPARPFDVVKSIVEEDLGRALEDVFDCFEESPVGAASIGQVHRAALKDGSRVVVKVMYPGVEGVFRGDVRTIKMFCEVAQPVHVPTLLEIERQFMTEFDYRREARQLDDVRRNMMAAGIAGDPSRKCAIPRPHLDLCTKRVLVMEELRGGKLTDELRKDVERQMDRMKKSLGKFGGDEEALERGFAREFSTGENGPTSEEYETFIKFLDAKRRLTNAYSALYNASVGWLPGVKKRDYEGKSSLPINHAKLIDDLLYIHGHQILVDGCFNGDPHPGNSEHDEHSSFFSHVDFHW
jgi:aarF domain-containing kinase